MTRKIVLGFIGIVLLCGSAVLNQEIEKEVYQVIRVWSPSEPTLNILRRNGISLDHTAILNATYIDLIARADQVSRLRKQSIEYSILIDDLGVWSAGRNIPATERELPLGSIQGNYSIVEAVLRMDSLHIQYPQIVSEKISIGTSIEGRDIWAFKVSDNPDTNESEPEVLYTGLTHAREPIGMMNQFYFVQYLCENYGSDEESTFLVDQREMWFIPILNPDGYQWNVDYYQTYGSPGYNRKNRRDTGCGTGTARGVDLNRNYEYDWGADDVGSSPDPCSSIYRGTAPFSEPETNNLKNFVLEHEFQNIIHYHAWGNDLIHSFGSGEYPPEPDYTMISEIGAWMTTENNYPVGTGTELLGYGVNGDAVDWSYGTLGLLSYLPEVGLASDYFWPSENRIVPLCQEQLYQNKVFALVSGSDPSVIQIEMTSPAAGAGGQISYQVSIQNRGLQMTSGRLGISVAPLNDFIQLTSVLDSIQQLDSRQIQNIQLTFQIPFDAITGEDTGFQITVSDSLSLQHSEVEVYRISSPTALPGDVITDLSQNILDVQSLAEILINDTAVSDFLAYIADVNGDSTITVEDLTQLVNIILEIE